MEQYQIQPVRKIQFLPVVNQLKMLPMPWKVLPVIRKKEKNVKVGLMDTTSNELKVLSIRPVIESGYG